MPPPLAAILIYAVAAAAQWQGHGSRARHAALDAALTAYPEIHAYGFAPDTGRASKHHSYEDHGSKPECPGLHE